MKSWLLVFLGGGLGSLLRYAVGRFVPATLLNPPFPLATLLVNVSASAVLGAVAGYGLSRTAGEDMRLLAGVGFCGGLSTFSSFSQDTLTQLQNGRTGAALLHIGLNVVLCLLASAGGMAAGQRL